MRFKANLFMHIQIPLPPPAGDAGRYCTAAGVQWYVFSKINNRGVCTPTRTGKFWNIPRAPRAHLGCFRGLLRLLCAYAAPKYRKMQKNSPLAGSGFNWSVEPHASGASNLPEERTLMMLSNLYSRPRLTRGYSRGCMIWRAACCLDAAFLLLYASTFCSKMDVYRMQGTYVAALCRISHLIFAAAAGRADRQDYPGCIGGRPAPGAHSLAPARAASN